MLKFVLREYSTANGNLWLYLLYVPVVDWTTEAVFLVSFISFAGSC
jgi:hypothetical protein